MLPLSVSRLRPGGTEPFPRTTCRAPGADRVLVASGRTVIEYGCPVVPVGQTPGPRPSGTSAESCEVAGGRAGDEPERTRGREDDEEEEALQSHRRAKVADLSDGDEDLLGD